MGHLKALVLAALMPLAHCGPVAIRDTPANVPALTAFKYSGSGCTQGSNSVKTVGGWNEATFSFSDFIANSPGEDATENCEVHFQGSGASAGWQVAVSELNVNGKVVLPPGTRFDYYWQIYWSDDASNTVSPHAARREGCRGLIETAHCQGSYGPYRIGHRHCAASCPPSCRQPRLVKMHWCGWQSGYS